MVAFDLLEEMNSKTFELIGTDAAEYGLASRIEIAIDECGAEPAHRQGRDRHIVGEDFPATHEAEGGMEMMCPARQLAELSRSLRFVGWFREKPAIENQNLIRAEDEIIGIGAGNRTCLRTRQMASHHAGGGAVLFKGASISLSSISGAITTTGIPAFVSNS